VARPGPLKPVHPADSHVPEEEGENVNLYKSVIKSAPEVTTAPRNNATPRGQLPLTETTPGHQRRPASAGVTPQRKLAQSHTRPKSGGEMHAGVNATKDYFKGTVAS
jgi:hypothetical protein